MKKFIIDPIADTIRERLQRTIDSKTKPLGALGQLEDIAFKVGSIQETVKPQLNKPAIVVFSGDHGISEDGEVNPYPQEVTWQMGLNFLAGGAAINVFAKQNNMQVQFVDAGVKYDFEDHPQLIKAKVSYGTENYLHQPAMTEAQCITAINRGARIIQKIHDGGCNVIGFGEMGIGNTASASLLMSALMELPVEACVGKGTGLDGEGVTKKVRVLSQVIKKHGAIKMPIDVLSTFGGFEIAMICGGVLQAAELRMVVLIDGFIVTSALLVAAKLYPEVINYCIFAHCSNEQGHQKMLAHLDAKPLLNLGLRLGEGTGAALSYPIVQAAVNFLNQMASFEGASVSNAEI